MADAGTEQATSDKASPPPPVSLTPMCRVVVSGGTHGDEMAGVYLAKGWLKDPSGLCRGTFSATPYLVNPRAVEKIARYTEKDINTCFLDTLFSAQDSEDTPYEVKRAKEINKIFGPKGSPEAYDLLLDMHTTTCNLGACIIVDNGKNYFAMHLANYLRKHYRLLKVRIYLHMRPKETSGTITSIPRCGITLEMGPVGMETLRADAYNYMRALVNCCLDFTDQFNQGATFPAFKVEAYQFLDQEKYPVGPDGEISAMVHPDVQDQDFLPVNPGEPVFQTFDGQDIPYSGDRTFYPVFTNDTGMYRSKLAFVKTEKLTFSIPAIQALSKCPKVPLEKASD